MKTPIHWQSLNLLSLALSPLGCLYALATWCRLKTHKPKKVNIPVICIGNLTAGGSGKTPTATAIAYILKNNGFHPFFVSRGYGGILKNVLVDNQKHTPQEVGDEPLLLSKVAPVVINSDRFAAAQKAVTLGADIIIMDDGFQNPTLFKDKSFLVIDGTNGMGNLLPIPAGPMREFLHQGLKRAQAVILLGEDKKNVLRRIKNLPIFHGCVTPVSPTRKTSKVIAFAGIGHPKKFYNSLTECGFDIVKTYDFPDHHFYTEEELLKIINEAQTLNAEIYTTAKDMVKIPAHLQSEFNTLEITIKWQDEAALTKFLLK